VYLKVDCGYGRAGVVPGTDAAIALAAHLHGSDCIDFRGLLAHGGHSYDCVNRAEIRVVAEQERAVVVGFADELRSQGLTISEVSIGSTPTMCVAEDLTGVTEIRPGNYALFDRFQATIGSCSMDEVAISVLATVIGAYPDRVLLDCGALALSKDPGPVHVDPDGGFGLLLTPDMRPVEGLSLVGLSQEHGKAKGPGATQFQVGDRMRVVPNHSCLTMACFEQVHIVDGTRVVDAWKPCRGW
jgi:D-serine deaminase-like pyridoxal phosphate-dependent protein